VKSSDTFFKGDILTEVCESSGGCDIDMRAYKGIAARSFARAVIAAPSLAEPLTKKLETSAEAAAGACVQESDECSLSWILPGSEPWGWANASNGNMNEVFNALAMVQSLLFSHPKPLASNGTEVGDDATQTGNATDASGAETPETGAAGTIAASVTAVLAVAFAAALSC
jgi:mannan endo-1,6-alpha-mannosidase